MIRVIIVDDDRIIKSVSDNYGEDIFMAWAQENAKSPGFCVFSKSGEILEIKDFENIFELLVRSALNSLDLKGVKKAYCIEKQYFDELKKLGFKENKDRVETVISEFFKPCCS